MKTKVAIFAFKGDPVCFAHVLLNALDLHEKGCDVRVVLEGAATAQIRELAEPGKPFAALYARLRDQGLVDCVCKACAAKMGALDAAKEQGLTVCDEMSGHPSLERYLAQGYQIITL
ncbi:MAG: cytoplasmic protein [Gemmatimonadales bacterium]|nr:MAG: cytoplasmic protein [Gemmatimonadales bacterium]